MLHAYSHFLTHLQSWTKKKVQISIWQQMLKISYFTCLSLLTHKNVQFFEITTKKTQISNLSLQYFVGSVGNHVVGMVVSWCDLQKCVKGKLQMIVLDPTLFFCFAFILVLVFWLFVFRKTQHFFAHNTRFPSTTQTNKSTLIPNR